MGIKNKETVFVRSSSFHNDFDERGFRYEKCIAGISGIFSQVMDDLDCVCHVSRGGRCRNYSVSISEFRSVHIHIFGCGIRSISGGDGFK